MKINVTCDHYSGEGLHQEEFNEVMGLSVNPDDGKLLLLDGEAVVLHAFAPAEWTAFAVQKED